MHGKFNFKQEKEKIDKLNKKEYSIILIIFFNPLLLEIVARFPALQNMWNVTYQIISCFLSFPNTVFDIITKY